MDIVGTIDREILVYLEQGGPTISKSVTVNGQVETQTVPLYRGVSEAGWYWVESRKPSRARHLDKAMFLDLLEEVCDYENRRCPGRNLVKADFTAKGAKGREGRNFEDGGRVWI